MSLSKIKKVGKTDPLQYNSDWETKPEFKDWIAPSSADLIRKGKGAAFCKVCHSPLRAHADGLKDHAKSLKHKAKISGYLNQKEKDAAGRTQATVVGSFGAASAEKEAKQTNDLKLACFVACHCSIRSIDHLGELLRDIGQGSRLASLRLHRTKCSQLIMKVIAPEMRREIVQDLGDEYYSVLVDESTDTTARKFMAVVIKYFNYRKKKMVVEFLGLVEVTSTTHEALYAAFTEFMAFVGIKVNRLYAIGTDGAPNMCGIHHSLYSLLKKNDAPWLVLIPCICHSLDKCASYASQELPSSLEFLIRETNGWFAHSALRRERHAKIYMELNNGADLPMLIKLCVTRWLSFGNAVSRTLELYDSLKQLFAEEVRASASDKNKKCYTASQLLNMYNDPSNKLYLTFLRPVLQEVNKYNAMFQSTQADITVVYKDFRTYVFATARRVLKREAIPGVPEDGILRNVELSALQRALENPANLLPVDRIELGGSFMVMAANSGLSVEELTGIKQRCGNFLLTLTRQMVQRLPSCIGAVERLRFFAPSRVLARAGRPTFQQLPLEFIPHSFDLDTLERQWATLGELKLVDLFPDVDDPDVKLVDIVSFWAQVWDLRNGMGEQPFRELAVWVLILLTLPLSNAAVERVFSMLVAVKTKSRNRLSLKNA